MTAYAYEYVDYAVCRSTLHGGKLHVIKCPVQHVDNLLLSFKHGRVHGTKYVVNELYYD